jgi:hypothetical protein
LVLVLLVLLPGSARAASDPLLEYTTKVHDPEGYGRYERIGRYALPTPRGQAGLVGYSNRDHAPHAVWASAWFLVTPEGKLYEVGEVTGPVDSIHAAEVDNLPAVAITTGDMHQGIGYEDTIAIYAAGAVWRFRREHREFDLSGDEEKSGPAEVTAGNLTLEPLPTALAKGLSARTFPKAPPPK